MTINHKSEFVAGLKRDVERFKGQREAAQKDGADDVVAIIQSWIDVMQKHIHDLDRPDV